ncbi:hypothetical protein [Sphingomonas alba]|uniref:Lipoprotein n=1 Tax=Sphingomonas alba TaxID=2908208 RepID=A0ABT0RN91_9SPHN|nr:hypothetical protein [Sphingomonas alba]MCL6684028.1 hypothetical protein [Sphingomonas alba]
MRHLALALLFVSPLFATGCNKYSPAENASANDAAAAPAAELYVIEAGTITGNRQPGINSWFKVKSSKDGIESDRLGGECILFRPADLGYTQMAGKTCTDDDGCATGEGYPYCHADSGKCWTRPIVPQGAKDPYCNRSVDYEPPKQWKDGELNKISAQAIPVPQGLKANAQARTYAILRLKDDAGPPMVKWGDPKPIP